MHISQKYKVTPNQKLMVIQNRVEHLCKFLNKYILNKTPDGRLNHSSPVKIGFHKSTYKVASVPTKSVVKDQDGNDKVIEHVSKEDEKIWEIEYQEHSDRVKKYKEDKIKVYAFLWNQCSKTMQTKVKAVKDFASKVEDDPVELMRTSRLQVLYSTFASDCW